MTFSKVPTGDNGGGWQHTPFSNELYESGVGSFSLQGLSPCHTQGMASDMCNLLGTVESHHSSHGLMDYQDRLMLRKVMSEKVREEGRGLGRGSGQLDDRVVTWNGQNLLPQKAGFPAPYPSAGQQQPYEFHRPFPVGRLPDAGSFRLTVVWDVCSTSTKLAAASSVCLVIRQLARIVKLTADSVDLMIRRWCRGRSPRSGFPVVRGVLNSKDTLSSGNRDPRSVAPMARLIAKEVRGGTGSPIPWGCCPSLLAK